VIVVSHDRYFLDRVVDRIVAVDAGRIAVFDGGYSAYAERATA
jgi:ATP-binding cassette subfamily F protein 3